MPSPSPTPQQPSPGPRTRAWDRPWFLPAVIVLIAVAIAAVYANSLHVPYLLDDADSITNNESIRQFSTALFPPRNSGITVSGRPLLNLSLAVNYHLNGTNVVGYHVGNMLIHAAAALALFGIVRRTLRLPCLAGRFGEHAPLLAAGSALLWALHPVQTESVTYIIQRAESLVGLCYLFTTYAFVRAVEKPSRAWLVITVIACFIGMTAKEVMSTAPLMLLLYDRTFVSGSFAESWRRRRTLYLWLASSWLVLLALIVASGSRGTTVGFGEVPVIAYVMTQAYAISRYLFVAFVPVGLIFDYGAIVEQRPEIVIPATLFVSLLVVATVWAIVKKPTAGFLGAWILVILAPTSSVIPVVTQLVAEHRMYTSLAAIAVGVALLLHRLSPRHGWWILALLVTTTGTLTVRRNSDFRSAISLWEDTSRKVPESARALTNLGVAYTEAGRTKEAVNAYAEAVECIPDSWTFTNLGIALAKLGEFEEGLAVLEKAVKLRPKWPQYHAIYGNALLYAKRPEDGIAQLKEAVRLEPENAAYHFDLANAFAQQDHFGEAESHYKESLRLAPDKTEAMINYAAMLRRMDKIAESIAMLQKALALKPESARAHSNLGVALLAIHHETEAVEHLRKALEADPKLSQALYNLACYCADTGRNQEAIGYFERLIAIEKPTAETLSNLAVLYAREDRFRDALARLKQALEIDPNHSAARENYDKISGYLSEHPNE